MTRCEDMAIQNSTSRGVLCRFRDIAL